VFEKMKEQCPICKNKDFVDLTKDVEENEDFIRYFKKHIYCPSCEKYMFIGDKKKLEALEANTPASSAEIN